MKILVPTDFSDTAKNATRYAVEFAKYNKAKIVLFHFYDIPIPVTDIPVYIDTDLLEQDANELLLENIRELHSEYGNDVEIEYHTKAGEAEYEIISLLDKDKFDYIIMGISGGSGVAERMIGSTTTGVIQKANCPVITVPKGTSFKAGGTVVFATDLATTVDTSVMNHLKDFIQLMHLKLHVVNVVDPDEKPTYEKALGGVKLEKYLEDINHSLHFPQDKDVVEGLNHFIEKHQIDMVAMIPKNHSFLDKIFHPSKTKKMAYFSHVPMITIHEFMEHHLSHEFA